MVAHVEANVKAPGSGFFNQQAAISRLLPKWFTIFFLFFQNGLYEIHFCELHNSLAGSFGNLAKVMKQKLITIFQLGRLGLAPLTMSVPVLGLFTAVSSSSFLQITLLALVGLCAHAFGFALNDLLDYPIDSHSPYRQKSPLVAGKISFRGAWVFVLLQPVIVLVVYGLWYPATAVSLVALTISFVLSILYNVWSKSGRLPRLFAELALAFSVGMLFLSGALLETDLLSATAVALAILLSLITLLVNSVSSGLKDIKTDQDVGAKSFVLATKSRVVAGNLLYISPKLRLYSVVIQLLIMGGFAWVAYGYGRGWATYVGVFCFTSLSLGHLRKLLRSQTFTQLRTREPLKNGFYNYFAFLWLLFPTFPEALQLFFILFGVSGGLLTLWQRSRPLPIIKLKG